MSVGGKTHCLCVGGGGGGVEEQVERGGEAGGVRVWGGEDGGGRWCEDCGLWLGMPVPRVLPGTSRFSTGGCWSESLAQPVRLLFSTKSGGECCALLHLVSAVTLKALLK